MVPCDWLDCDVGMYHWLSSIKQGVLTLSGAPNWIFYVCPFNHLECPPNLCIHIFFLMIIANAKLVHIIYLTEDLTLEYRWSLAIGLIVMWVCMTGYCPNRSSDHFSGNVSVT